MDKNTITGLVLIGVVLMGFSFWSSSKQQEAAQQAPQTEQVYQKETDATKQQASEATVDTVDSKDAFYNCVAKATDSVQMVVLENSKLKVEINPVGGMIANVYLKEYDGNSKEYKYRTYNDFKDGKNVALNLYKQNDASLEFILDTKEKPFKTGAYHFAAVEKSDSAVTMRLMSADSSATFDFVYSLRPDNYMVDFDIVTKGMDKYVPVNVNKINIKWNEKISQLEKGFKFEHDRSTLTYKYKGDDSDYIGEYQSESENEFDGDLEWVAFKNQYFSSVLIADKSFTPQEFNVISFNQEQEKGYLKEYTATMQANFDATGKEATRMQFYFGPNNYRLLQSMDESAIGGEKNLELEELVYLGWPLFKWINRFFTLYVFDFLTAMGLPMGIVLLLITILMRFIVYVPTKKSFLSSAKMRVLKPKIDEIAKQYPKQEDAMKRQQATMTLYSQYGVSPMGGCLPMLIQMPLWIAMFNFIPNAIELRQEAFLWAEDLSTYDSLISWNTHIWGIGDHLSLFCLLFCATNILYSVMSMRQQRETMSAEQAQQMKVMQWMMYLMPVMFFFMFNDFSAGLNYYYFISLLASALTMWYLRKTTDDAKLLAKLEKNFEANKNNPNKKPSGLAARLEALQKQQEALMEEQRRRQQGK